MSKYLKKGAYHFHEYGDPTTTYHKHVESFLEKAREILEPGMKVLDAGCGEGLFVKLLRQDGVDAEGVDSDPHAVALAVDHGLREFVHQAVFAGNYGKYDAILMMDSLEHTEDWRLILHNASKNCRIMFIAVPDRHDPYGINQMIGSKIITFMDDEDGWNCTHNERRYARDFFIYEKVVE